MSGSGSPGFRPRFFIQENQPADILLGAELSLSAEDSHHARHVLRLGPGDPCEVAVGAAVYAASVSTVGEVVTVRVEARLEGSDAGASYRLQVGLVQALSRPAAIDTVLEKATEVGCSFFLLVRSAGSPKWAESWREDRMVRWQRIVREAAKQSKQVALPSIVPLGAPGDALQHLRETGTYSLVLDPRASVTLYEALAVAPPGVSPHPAVALWIGPEGGWAEAELAQFESAGVGAVRLGRSILRTETAGPVALAVARLALGDW